MEKFVMEELSFIKHFNWQAWDMRGRVAIALTEDERVRIVQIAGNAPPVGVLMIALHVLGNDVLNRAQELNRQRRNRYGVQKRDGMSGATDYLLRYERDAEIADYPIGARLHVSMYDKLNEPVNMWLGDFTELVAVAMSDYDYYYGLEPHESGFRIASDRDAHDLEIEWREAPLAEIEWIEPVAGSGDCRTGVLARRGG